MAIAAVVAVAWIGSLVTQSASLPRTQAAETAGVGALLGEFKAFDLAPVLPPVAPTAEDAPAAPTF